jgi:anti-sigma B factor antagonist
MLNHAERSPVEPVAPRDYFDVDIRASESATVIALRGELDVGSAKILREAITSVERNGDVDLDAVELTFIDSSGLRVLVESSKRLNRFGGKLTVANAQPTVYRVFEIVGLVDRLQVTEATS